MLVISGVYRAALVGDGVVTDNQPSPPNPMPPPLAVNRCVLTVNARGARIPSTRTNARQRRGRVHPGGFRCLLSVGRRFAIEGFGAVLRLAIHLNRVRQRRAVTTFRVHRTRVVLFDLKPGFESEIVVWLA